MSTNPIGVCIIGCGAMGRNHAQAWSGRDDARVLAVFDPVAEAREAMAAEFDATAYDSQDAAIEHEGVQAVSICTPLPFHRQAACFAAERGRHILCEKPLAGSREDCDAILDAARRHDVQLCVGHQYRNWPRNQRLRQAYLDGVLGTPLMARYTLIFEVRPKLAMHRRSMNKGPVMDVAPHFIDLMRFFTGAEPTEVFATGAVFGKGKPRLEPIDEADLAIDAAHLQVRFDGGHVLSVELCWGMPEDFPGTMEESIFGPLGRMRKASDGAFLIRGKDAEMQETLDHRGGGPEARVDDLARAIRENRPPEVSGEDGRVSVLTALAALESIETGRPVNVNVNVHGAATK